MTKINKHIEIVCASLPSLSSMGPRTAAAILAVLETRYTRVGITIVNNVSSLKALIATQPDLIFLGMKFIPGFLPGKKIWISEVLDEENIAYTGSAKEAMRFEQNKAYAKEQLLSVGVATARYKVLKHGELYSNQDISLNYPLFVKPAGQGGGKGIDSNSLVYTTEELNSKAQSLTDKYVDNVLVEEYLSGREFTVALLGNVEDRLLVMPLELIAEKNDKGDRILGKQAKKDDREEVVAVTDHDLRQSIINFAVKAFAALGARDYGRIDIRLDAHGVPSFLEANLIPGLGSGYYTRACMINENISYSEAILRIVQLALSRTSESEIPEVDLGALFVPTAAVI